MMEWARDSLKRLEDSRDSRRDTVHEDLSPEEIDLLLEEHHPDHSGKGRDIAVGANANATAFPVELADLLESQSRLPKDYIPRADIETDVLIIGGGGAACSAALTLNGSGLKMLMCAKLRLGDSNTVMAEGGIQAALGPEDSAQRHFADSLVGGHGKNDPQLLKHLCEQGPEGIRWLTELGCLFDLTEGGMFRLRLGGGASVPRVLACRDYTGLEIMRTLKDATRLTETEIMEDCPALELLDDGAGQVTGATVWDRQQNRLRTVSARAVLLATGGAGQLRFQQFGTSNHVGATGDGLVLAYRQGCHLEHGDSFQYHPSGSCYPEAISGRLVTEAIRSIGAQVVNNDGHCFINELTYRDVLAAAIIREVREGRGIQTPAGSSGVWLDTPMIDIKQGAGTLQKQFPGIVHRFAPFGIDPSQTPILIYPTLHYQNGGVRVDEWCRTEVDGLWAAGEVTGGLHGTNRLMGNSLLDIITFGRRAGESIKAHLPKRKATTRSAADRFQEDLKKRGSTPVAGPQLFPVDMNMNATPGQ